MWSVSVVIPARNDAAALGAAVGSVLAQHDAEIVDIVIAVGPSTDDTSAEARRLAASDGRIGVIESPSGRTADALNLAIAATSGDVVVRVDARAELPAGYVKHALETMQATGAANVGAVQRPVGSTPTSRAVAAAMRSRLGSGGAPYRHAAGLAQVETAYLGVFRREALVAVGGFDRRFIRNQDSELNIRLRNAGYEVWLDPRLIVQYAPRSTLRALFSQYWQYGVWRARTVRRHRGSIQPRQLVPPLAVLVLLASCLGGLLLTPWLLLVPVCYLGMVLASAGSSAGLTAGERLRCAAALVIMHIAWGAGFIVSTILPNPVAEPLDGLPSV